MEFIFKKDWSLKPLKLISAFTMIIAIKMVFIKSIYYYKCTNFADLISTSSIYIWTSILTYICKKKYCMQFLVFIIAYPFLWLFPFFPSQFFIGCQMELIFVYLHWLSQKSGSSKLSFGTILAIKNDWQSKKSYHHLCDMFMKMIKPWPYQKKWTEDL
jgi:hypothetical protein